MKIPVFLPVTREFGFRDEFAQDCLLQQGVRNELLIDAAPFAPVAHRNRRLAKDFETSIARATAWMHIASTRLLVRRLACP
jgi:hypothetical protein